MDRKSGTVRAALAGTAIALCLASTFLAAACAVKQPFDYPVMRLTDPPAVADARPQQ